VLHGSHRPFSSSHACSQRACLHSTHQRQSTSHSCRHSHIQTQCVAPNTQSVGRRVVGSVATAAFLTWALRSASAKSMKPSEVQRRSKEEENTIFENRDGEVCITNIFTAPHKLLACLEGFVSATKTALTCTATPLLWYRCITQRLNGSPC
jgi:hypothetical protein